LNKLNRGVALALTLVMALAVVLGVVGAQDSTKVLNVNWGQGDVPSLDPSLGTDTSSIQIVESLTVGLTRLSEEGVVEAGMATDWTVSDDGLVYTFNLLQDVPWVAYDADAGEVVEVTDADGNVRIVTANDFIYGMKRSLNPETGSYYGGVMSAWIVGGAEAINDEGSLDDVAIVALDDFTLEITVTQPAAFLPNIFGMWMAVAQPEWAIAEFGDEWTEAVNINSYGPFALKEWLHGESLTLIANPFWPGTDSVPVSTIGEVYGVMLEASAALANYEAGLIDTVAPPSADLDRIIADPILSLEYTVIPSSCTYSYIFNTSKAPFDDVRVRQAFSMAINRQDLIDNVLKAGQEPAFFWSRPDLVAAPTAELYPDLIIGEDDEMAQALLQEYIDEVGELAPILLMHNESESHARIAAAVQNMWGETLGIDNIEVQTQEWAVYLETIKADETAPQIFRYAWCWDYLDTHSFLFDVFHSSVREVGIGWDRPSSDEFDALVEAGVLETDTELRREIYSEAEFLLTNEEAILAPIYYYTGTNLTKPYVERTFSVGFAERYEKWDLSN